MSSPNIYKADGYVAWILESEASKFLESYPSLPPNSSWETISQQFNLRQETGPLMWSAMAQRIERKFKMLRFEKGKCVYTSVATSPEEIPRFRSMQSSFVVGYTWQEYVSRHREMSTKERSNTIPTLLESSRFLNPGELIVVKRMPLNASTPAAYIRNFHQRTKALLNPVDHAHLEMNICKLKWSQFLVNSKMLKNARRCNIASGMGIQETMYNEELQELDLTPLDPASVFAKACENKEPLTPAERLFDQSPIVQTFWKLDNTEEQRLLIEKMSAENELTE